MQDAAENTLGIRLRLPDGRKLSVRRGCEGLFIPGALDAGRRLLICEGPTDTAAMLDLGFSAVGRPSCTGGVRLLVELARRWRVPELVVVADSDVPGQRGAESLASVLAAYCPVVRIIAPPAGIKDARAWKLDGAMAAGIEAAIGAAPPWKLTFTVRERAEKAR
jgi:hypothetical protein